MSACTIYRIEQRLIIVSMYETDSGFYKLTEPVKVLESSKDFTEAGNAVLEILTRSREGVTASSPGGIVPAILKAAGVKSWRKFEAEMTECIVELSGQTIEVTPCASIGDGAGVHLTDRTEKCTADPRDLGDAVIRALNPPQS